MTVPWYRCPAYNPGWARAGGHGRGAGAGRGGRVVSDRAPKVHPSAVGSEFDCDFVGSGLAIFPLDLLDAATRGAWGERAPEKGHKYLTSVDIGRRRDATVINTIDTTSLPYQRVAFERLERVPYPVIQSAIERRARAYPGPVHMSRATASAIR
jgi:hypothetical protein